LFPGIDPDQDLAAGQASGPETSPRHAPVSDDWFSMNPEALEVAPDAYLEDAEFVGGVLQESTSGRELPSLSITFDDSRRSALSSIFAISTGTMPLPRYL
jgi:hypothetical protein